jgi:hypothetical protein
VVVVVVLIVVVVVIVVVIVMVIETQSLASLNTDYRLLVTDYRLLPTAAFSPSLPLSLSPSLPLPSFYFSSIAAVNALSGRVEPVWNLSMISIDFRPFCSFFISI